jgi:GDP-L-fucose synthase
MADTGEPYTAARAGLRADAEAHAGGDRPAETTSRGRAGRVPPLPRDARIFVSGHQGLVGAALHRRLRQAGYRNLLTATREQLDLRDQAAVSYWFKANRPEYVFLVAGTVGGVMANSTRQAEFLYDNLMIHGTVVHSSHEYGVRRLLYLGSSCIYPRDAPQPITEDRLLTGPLEPTNEGYALAKIAGMKLCQFYREQYGDDFICAMPTNVYGPGDNFDAESAHLVPMLMRRFHEAKRHGDREVTVWGTGSARRELMHVDDLAEACLFLIERDLPQPFVNVGTGEDLPVRSIATMLRDIVHPQAELVFDPTKPDGMPRKVLDVSRIRALGWRHHIDLADGLRATYDWYRNAGQVRGQPSGTSAAA